LPNPIDDSSIIPKIIELDTVSMSTSIDKEVVILNPSYSTIFPPENLNTLCDQNGGKNNGRKIGKICVPNAARTFPPDSYAGKELNKKRWDTAPIPLSYNFHSLLSVGDKLLSSKCLSAFQSFFDYYIKRPVVVVKKNRFRELTQTIADVYNVLILRLRGRCFDRKVFDICEGTNG
jgi:hypothetical protein